MAREHNVRKRLAPARKPIEIAGSAMDYVLRINRIHMRNVAQLLGPKGLLQGEWLVLDTIRALGPIGVGDLARRMTMERSTISKMLERMERRNLIARTTHGYDRRASPVVITRAGRSKLRNTEGDVRHLLDGCMRGFDASSKGELVRLLAVLENNIGSILERPKKLITERRRVGASSG